MSSLGPIEESLLVDRVVEHNELRFYELLVLVTAIQESARIASGAGGSFEKTSDRLKKFQALLFPELSEELAETVQNTQALLQKEHERGPMKVKALDFETNRKKKKRR